MTENQKTNDQATAQAVDLNTQVRNAIEEYQCPGCVCGWDTECYKKSHDLSCQKHVHGTIITGIGSIFLGLPKGFNRLGVCEKTKINIFDKFEDGLGYDMWNVPVWKYLNNNGHTFVRGLCTRNNYPFIHIFLENCIEKIQCIEITQKDIDEMD